MEKRYIYPFLTVLAALLTLQSCKSTITNSNQALGPIPYTIVDGDDGTLPGDLAGLYHSSAEKLAVRFINRVDSTRTDVPETVVNTFYNGLVHIAQSGTRAAERVSEEYKIGALAPGHPRQVIVYADSTAPWLDAWRSDTARTGNPSIDVLVDRFKLSFVEFKELKHTSDFTLTILESEELLNMHAVGRYFTKNSDLVRFAGYDGIFGGHRDITVKVTRDSILYTFFYGSGDCPSGCINKHYWDFRVNPDGSVEFLGERDG